MFHRGPPTFFLTLTADLVGWEDLHLYLDEIWKFRDAPRPQQRLFDVDTNFVTQFVIRKFQALRQIMTSLRFWGKKVVLSFTRTEFQLRGMPHWHLLVWLDVPWDTTKFSETSPELPEVIRFFDSFVCSDTSLLEYPAKQKHPCVKGQCDRRNRKDCKYGYPRYPLPE